MAEKTRRFVKTLLSLGFQSELDGYKELLAFFIRLAHLSGEEQKDLLRKPMQTLFSDASIRVIDYSIEKAHKSGQLKKLNDLLGGEVITYKPPSVKKLINLLYQYFRYF